MSIRIPCSALALLALLAAPALAHADDDAMAPYRARFRAGMDRYKDGDYATAIAGWEAIYRDVGPEKGYRVAFDLGRAYEKSNDAPRARERYQAFLDAVTARRGAGQAIEAIVAEEETEAKERIAHLPVEAPEPAVAAPTPASASSAPAPASVSAPASASAPAPASASPRALASAPANATHPFSPLLPFLSGAATAAAIVVCAVEYSNAVSKENAFLASSSEPYATRSPLLSAYDGTVTPAYVSLGVSIGLAALTTTLTLWYFVGTKPAHEPAVAPTASWLPGGGTAGVTGRF